MKNTAPTTALAGDSTRAEAVVSSSGPSGPLLTDGKSPLPSETLLRLGTLYGDQQVAIAMGDESEVVTARGVIAGIIVTLHEILPAKQFRAVMVQWEVDAIKLSELLQIGASRPGNEDQSIEV